MSSRLLTLDDLIQFYSTKKKSMSFSAEKTGEPIVVQVNGKISFEKNDDTEGLTAVRLQACHTEKNLNKSSISFETMQNKMLPSFKNRPILGYIHEVAGEYHFADHRMHIEENEDNSELVYDEIAVGIIPETNNAELIYDEENDRYNVMVDGYLFDEYTKASEILQREQECFVSVEISIRKMSWDAKVGCLNIEDGFFSGVTILGLNEDGSKVMPGMAGSNIKLKDFSKSNNSIFSSIAEEDKVKLIEMQNTINEMVSRFNINENHGKEEEIEMDEVKVNEEVNEEVNESVVETESTEEVVAENSEELVDTPEVVETEACKKRKCEEETVEEISENFDEDSDKTDNNENVENEENVNEETEEDNEINNETEENVISVNENEENEKFSKTFELSHDDTRCALYALLASYESANNDWYWITDIYDSYFVYQGMMGDYHGQKYVKNEDDTVAFDGEPYALYAEFLTESERAALTEMRSNYSSIQTELNAYKEAEEIADKMTVFEDQAYSAYLDTEEFKSLMSKETVKQFSKEELVEKADAALGKVVKATKTFAMETKKEEIRKPSFFAFAKQEQQSSFLDGLLKK